MSETWIKLDVDFPAHPKILEVGPVAGWAMLSLLCYSRRYLTDGAVSYGAMHAAYSLIEHHCGEELGSPVALASLLADAGLLEANGSGWVIHDYAEHQQTKQMVQERKAHISRIRTEAGRKGGLAKATKQNKQTPSNPRVEVEKDINPPTPLTGENSKSKTFRCDLCQGGLEFKTQGRLDDHLHIVHDQETA